MHETVNRDTLGALAEFYEMNNPKGEIVIIVGGSDVKPEKEKRRKYDPDAVD